MPQRKTLVIDTNVLISDPNSIKQLQNDNADKDLQIVIPIYVLEELDKHKKQSSEVGANCRQVTRYLDSLRSQGSLLSGVKISETTTLFVGYSNNNLPHETIGMSKLDDRILALALHLMVSQQDWPLTLVTKDLNLRVRADSLGVIAEDYNPSKLDDSSLYSGAPTIELTPDCIHEFYTNSKLTISLPDLHHNQYIHFKDICGSNSTGLARYNKQGFIQQLIKIPQQGIWGIRPKNKEQTFLIDALLDDSIKLVTAAGISGAGKTLICLAAGLHKVAEEKKYDRMSVARPVVEMGKGIGYLPGSMSEKLEPWMQPIHDNLEFLLGMSKLDKQRGRSSHEFFELGLINVEPLTYIRGRSMPNQWILIDETQNLTPHEIKTIITRAGDNTKIVLTGDPFQCDNPHLDVTNNGLTYVIEKFKGQHLFAEVTLKKGERSELSELAATLL